MPPSHMFALSTSWNSKRHSRAEDLIREIKDTGFTHVELGFALTEAIVNGVQLLTQKKTIQVVSLHNMCPLPKEIPLKRASPDYYSLSSLDEEERKRAVEIVKRTIMCAQSFGAKVVVVHIGRVDGIAEKTRKLASVFDDKKQYAAVKEEMIRSRMKRHEPFFEKAVQSLKELTGFAKESGVALAVENRYYYNEIPSLAEAKALFTLFSAADLFYWHDIGHAEVSDRLGLVPHEDYLKAFPERLAGVHLHDVSNRTRDHKAPGCGTFDFKKIVPFLRNDTLKVIEAHHPATAEDIRNGRELLKQTLVNGEPR